MSEVEDLGFEEARELISKMAELKNRLRDLSVIRDGGRITLVMLNGFVQKGLVWSCVIAANLVMPLFRNMGKALKSRVELD